MSESEDVAALRRRLDIVERDLTQLRDVQAVRTLQFQYGYYMDKGLYDEVVDLFAVDGELFFMGGIFRGREGLRRLYCGRLRQTFTGGHNGPIYGMLCDHIQLQDIVTVAPDGLTARGRFRALLQGGSHETKPDITPRLPLQWWEAGVYENTYVKEAGIWKIRVNDYNLFWTAEFERGWAHAKPFTGSFFSKTYPDDPLGPDALFDRRPAFWPETPVVPFHYPHPVTGAMWDLTRTDGRRGSLNP